MPNQPSKRYKLNVFHGPGGRVYKVFDRTQRTIVYRRVVSHLGRYQADDAAVMADILEQLGLDSVDDFTRVTTLCSSQTLRRHVGPLGARLSVVRS